MSNYQICYPNFGECPVCFESFNNEAISRPGNKIVICHGNGGEKHPVDLKCYYLWRDSLNDPETGTAPCISCRTLVNIRITFDTNQKKSSLISFYFTSGILGLGLGEMESLFTSPELMGIASGGILLGTKINESDSFWAAAILELVLGSLALKMGIPVRSIVRMASAAILTGFVGKKIFDKLIKRFTFDFDQL